MIKKPYALENGSTLGIIAPAGPAYKQNCVELGKATLEALGFKVVVAPNALNKNKYLAGSDLERAADLCRMFQDRSIDGIICLRGGYGSMRILHKVDYRLIRRHPKALVGYSDITALQLAIWKRTGLVTFSGPMLTTDFGCNAGEFTLRHFLRAVQIPLPLGLIPPAPGVKTTVIYPGRARGRLLGGNLSLVTATLGTPYEIDCRGSILFLEEVGEQPYRVDRMLCQLLLAGKLTAAAGIIFGECINCEAEDMQNSFTLLDVIRGYMEKHKIPSFYGLGAGHGPHKATLPLGVKAEMDAEKGLLTITEPATIVY